jgi:hypothetical protein
MPSGVYYRANRRPLLKLKCLNCGDIFNTKERDRRFCSPSCSSTYNNFCRGGLAEETKRKISEAHQGKMKGALNPAKRIEVRKKISRALKGRRNHWMVKCKGQKRPHTSRSLVRAYQEGRARPRRFKNGGYRKDLKQYFRSSWEANYARFLTWKGLRWIYEPKAFSVIVEGKHLTYTPDFFLPDKAMYIEVKGYWASDLAKQKFKAFEKIHHIVLVGPRTYKRIEKSFSNKVKNWEFKK